MLSAYTRVAVVQIAYHPAVAEMLDDPLFDPKASRHSFVLDGAGVPKKIESAYKNLRARVRKAYVKQLGRRLDVILQHCQDWKVRLVVFPEYSIPAELLERLAQKAPEIVIVAGTHFVDAEGRRSQVYERLLSTSIPAVRNAVCPVLHQGKALSMGAKVHPVEEEQRLQFVSGKTWNGVATPEGIEGPMGVLICRDFLSRDTEQHRTIIAENLAPCRFLAVPSLTPSFTVDEFVAKFWEQARRERRPVLYANDASGGGTSVYVYEDHQLDVQGYPARAGLLGRHEEGMIVADVNLGYERTGTATPYDKDLPVKPFAAATFVYRGLESDYAKWFDKLAPLLEEKEGDEFEQLEAIREFVKANEPPMGKATATRERRLRRLLHDVENLPGVEFVRALTREVVFPEDVLPLNVVRAAMARGAAREVERWVGHDGKFGPVKDRLHEPWDKLELATTGWAEKTRITVADVVKEVAGEAGRRGETVQVTLVDILEQAAYKGFEDEYKAAYAEMVDEHYEEGRERVRAMLERAQKTIADLQETGAVANAGLEEWAERCKLMMAIATLNLQDRKGAHDALLVIEPSRLPAMDRMQLAETLAMVDEADRAKQVLPREAEVPEGDRHHWRVAQQIIEITEGSIPAELVDDATARLFAAEAYLNDRDYAAAARLAFGVLANIKSIGFERVRAVIDLWMALQGTVLEESSDVNRIPEGEERAKIIDRLETEFTSCKGQPLSAPIRAMLRTSEKLFRICTHDSLQVESVVMGEMNSDPEEWEKEQEQAFELARNGRVEDAFRVMRPFDHPWLGELARVDFLLSAKKSDEAWELARVLVGKWENRALIEWKFAQLSMSKKLYEEARTHAKRAFVALPGIGYRVLFAQALGETGDPQPAWALLQNHAHDERADVQQTRADIAQKLGKFVEAVEAARRYLVKRPNDARMQVFLASELFRSNKVEEAAVIAWKAFETHGDEIDADLLFVCGSLQSISGIRRRERTRRIKLVADKLKTRYPTDAHAEKLWFQLLQQLDHVPDDVSIDAETAVKHGFVPLMPADMAKALVSTHNDANDNLSILAMRGHLPVMVASRHAGTGPALLVSRLLDRSRTVTMKGHLCPPVAVPEQPPVIRLQGAKILLSDLELTLLVALDLHLPLLEALDSEGRLIVFENVRDRIISDAAILRMRHNLIDIAAGDRVALEYAIDVHQLVLNEKVLTVKAPNVPELPPCRTDAPEFVETYFRGALEETLAYRQALELHDDWWFLNAEHFGTTNFGHPAFVSSLAWTGQEQYASFVTRKLATTKRDLTLPALVRLLVPDVREAERYLLKLVEFGFPDALGRDELLRLERRYNGFQHENVQRLLYAQEWMARDPDHDGRHFAVLRLAHVYAGVIFHAFVESDRTEAERLSVVDALMGRIESIGRIHADALGFGFTALASLTIDRWQEAWNQDAEEETRYRLRQGNPIVALWTVLSSWSGNDGSRRAAFGRVFRQIWKKIAQSPIDPHPLLVATLLLAHAEATHQRKNEWSFMEPDIEAMTILSVWWKENPFAKEDGGKLLDLSAGTFAKEPMLIVGGREIRYQGMFPNLAKPVTIRIPVEALFLRFNANDRKKWIEPLARMQGPYDGIAYRLLDAIKNAPPNDEVALRNYADHAAGAFFRLVQDDPSYLRIWPQARLGNEAISDKFDELLEILSESAEPIAPDVTIGEVLSQRFHDAKGAWFHRVDQFDLLARASEIPGTLPAVTIPLRFANKVYADHVRESLDRLDRSDEHPIARIAGDVMFLRVAAARRPHVKLVEGDIDLRDILPGRFLRLLEKVSAPPAPDTLGAAEPALLRVCGEVMMRLTVGKSLSLKYALWLIYRLFQWLCLQLEAISPDARIQGLRQLVQQAPAPQDREDLLDPVGLSRERFDHRLATVLHAFGVMEDLTNVVPEQLSANEGETQENKVSVADISFSSSEFEDKLIELAQRAHLGPSPSSVLDWHGPGNVPDLALHALLRLSPKRFADMTPESRLRRFEKLPDDPQECETEDRNQLNLMHLVLIAAANVAANLTPEERSFLEAKVRGMVDGAITRQWQWLLFVNFFESGADHLQEDAWRLMQEHWQHEMAPMAFGWFVLAISRRDLTRVEPTIEATIAGATEQGADAVALVAGALGRLRVHGTPAGQKLARSLLLQLAERPPFREDPRMVELIGFFGLRKAES